MEYISSLHSWNSKGSPSVLQEEEVAVEFHSDWMHIASLGFSLMREAVPRDNRDKSTRKISGPWVEKQCNRHLFYITRFNSNSFEFLMIPDFSEWIWIMQNIQNALDQWFLNSYMGVGTHLYVCGEKHSSNAIPRITPLPGTKGL